jgi:hypothetical protein
VLYYRALFPHYSAYIAIVHGAAFCSTRPCRPCRVPPVPPRRRRIGMMSMNMNRRRDTSAWCLVTKIGHSQ